MDVLEVVFSSSSGLVTTNAVLPEYKEITRESYLQRHASSNSRAQKVNVLKQGYRKAARWRLGSDTNATNASIIMELNPFPVVS